MPISKSLGDLSEKELRELISQLEQLTDKYKRAEKIQKALFDISELASSIHNLDQLYPAVHQIVGDFVTADNFYVAFHYPQEQKVDFAYFIDERDQNITPNVPYQSLMSGITGHILRSGESIVMSEENAQELLAERGIHLFGSMPVDLIGVALKRENETIGAMVVQSYNTDVRYDKNDYEVMSFISQHIVNTVDRVKSRELTEKMIRSRTKQLRITNEELQEEIKEREKVEALQKALFEICELSISVDHDLEKFYVQLHQILSRLINAPNCYIALLNDQQGTLQFPYFSDTKYTQENEREFGLGLTECVIRKGEAMLIDKFSVLELVKAGELDASIAQEVFQSSNSWLGAPLLVDGTVSGVIGVQTYGLSQDYTLKDLDLLRFVSHHIAVALARRNNADAMRRYNLELTEKVQARTEELNQTNEYLKKQIEQRKEIELKLIHEAHHDNLTDLPNRALFNSRLELAIANKQRHPENQFAVLFIDLDRFKLINDTLGHHAGDEFLVEVAARISQCKRAHDLLARLGGDEFVVLVDNFEHTNAVEQIAQRIIESVAAPFCLDGQNMYSGASIGIAHIDSGYHKADEVMRDADAAMYQAKSLGRGRFVTFDKTMRENLLAGMELENDLRRALADGNFKSMLRPIINFSNNAILYYDCAVEWHHKDDTPVDKTQFWKVVEQAGLTLQINDFILHGVCDVLNKWQHMPDKKSAKIGVSLSIEHLLQPAKISELIKLVDNCGFSPDKLILAFSETALSSRAQFTVPSLKKLKRHGFGLVLDNFGSGSASLNYLFSYPYDFVKLAPRFVQSFTRSNKHYKFVEAISMVCQQAQLTLIADGIDSEAKLTQLRKLNYEYGQGKYVAAEQPISLTPQYEVSEHSTHNSSDTPLIAK